MKIEGALRRGVRTLFSSPYSYWGSALALGAWLAIQLDEQLPSSADLNVTTKLAPIRGLVAEAGLPEAWGDFFALVAWRESKGNPQSINDSVSEADAAARAYDRNRHRYEACGYAASSYTFGSGGWFGFLPANGLAQLGKSNRCLPPPSVFEPRVAMAMAVGFARGLMRWDEFKRAPTWLNLRAMWGSPSMGGDAEFLRNRRMKYREDIAAVGLPPSWLDRRPPPLPITGAEVLARLQAA